MMPGRAPQVDLREVGSFLRYTATHLDQISLSRMPRIEPRPSTPAYLALSEPIQGPSGEWSPYPRHLAPQTARSYLDAAAEHLGNLGTMLQHDIVSLTPDLVLRALLEQSARVAWLVEKGESLRALTARAFLDRIYVIDSTSGYRQRFGTDHYNAQIENTKATTEHELNKAFYKEEICRHPSGALVHLSTEERPGPTKSTTKYLQGMGLPKRDAAGLYAYLSARVHPNALAIEETLKASGADNDHLREMITTCMACFHTAYRTLTAYLGSNYDDFNRWENALDVALPGALSSPPQTPE